MNNPKVSIIIPVYNGSNFLKEAIDSALAQTYKNIEVIVINDGSNDNGATESIAKSYGKKIKYYKKENGGVATALNFGIEKMTGKYFSWLSHDDLYEKNKIEDQVNLIKTIDRSDVIVAANARVLYANGVLKEELIDKNLFDFFDIFLATSAEVGINGCTLLIPRKALVDNKGFNTNLPVTQDYDLWFRLNKSYSFVLLEKNLVISRRHDSQDSVIKQKRCLEDSENLHYDFLINIGHSRFELFFKSDEKNIKKTWDSYILYKTNGYKKTASMILKNILEYYYKTDKQKYYEIFQSEIGTKKDQDLVDMGNSKKRILLFSNVWHKGGIERVLSHIIDNFNDKYNIFLVVNDDKVKENIGYKIPDNVSFIKINNQNQIVELMNLLSLFNIDIFVGNPNFSDIFIDIYSLLKDTNIKSIAYNHGCYFLPYMCDGYLYPVALKFKNAYKDADYVIWLAQVACNLYNVDRDNGLYLPNPVHLIPDKGPKTTPNKNLLAVGRFDDEIKRIDNILLTFKALYGLDHSYHLDIVGYCPMELKMTWKANITVEDFIKQENIPLEKITFWGIQENVSKFYKEAGFLLMGSRCEGLAMVLLESMSYGTPCACFDYIGVEDVIQNGQNGWVLPAGSFIEMANKINDTVNNKKTYQEMSKKSLELVQKYGIDLFCDKWQKLIDKLLENDTHVDNMLLPSNKLNSEDYKRVIIEYEKLLNAVIKNYIGKQTTVCGMDSSIIKSRFKNITGRFRTSIKRDGLLLTGEKILRKVYKKIKNA